MIDSPPNGGTNWFIASGGRTTYIDSLSVTSPSLPVGTPVQIEFSYHVNAALSATHSESPGGNNNNAFVLAFVQSLISGSASGSHFIDGDDNKAVLNTANAGSDLAIGLMNPATPHLNVTYNAQVGDTLNFSVLADVATNGDLAPITVSFNPITLANTFGGSSATLGLAFGATPLDPNVVLMSQVLNNSAFPAAANANAANAQASAPSPIPAPATIITLSLFGFHVMRPVRRHRTSRP